MNKSAHVDSSPRRHQEVEGALQDGLRLVLEGDTTAPLGQAMRHAVLGPGSRFRPRLVFAVAESSGPFDARFAAHAAAAVEFLHAASLVHDDLPAFDDASLRRGKPTVHRKFGEALAILAGDALIVGAYQILHAGVHHHPRGNQAMGILFRAGGAASGLAKGQALELAPCESSTEIAGYHYAKTGVLFEAAAALGALAASADPAPWIAVGRELGALYQRLDDLADVIGDPRRLGKDVGNDAKRGRPTSVGFSSGGLGREATAQTLEPHLVKLRATVPRGAVRLDTYVEELVAEATARLLSPLDA